MEKCCVICLENEIESNYKMIEYNHCGKYYIHSSCLNKWNIINDCFICREKIVNETVITPIDNITIQDNIPRRRRRTNSFFRCIECFIWFCS